MDLYGFIWFYRCLISKSSPKQHESPHSLNPGLINSGWLIVVLPPNSDFMATEMMPPKKKAVWGLLIWGWHYVVIHMPLVKFPRSNIDKTIKPHNLMIDSCYWSLKKHWHYYHNQVL
jgi:hypothetical protein